MLLKNIVIGLLLNTITLTQASTDLADKEAAERNLYLEHYQTKERMIKLYDSLNLGKDKKMTAEQQEKMKPITTAFGDLDKKVKALAKLREEQEAKDKEQVAKAPETSVGLPKEIPQAEPEIAKVSPPLPAAPVSKPVDLAPAKAKVDDTPQTSEVVAPAADPLPVEKVAEPTVAQPDLSKVAEEKPIVETKPQEVVASKPEQVAVTKDIKTEAKEKTIVPPQEEKSDTAESVADSTKTAEKSTQEEADKENKEQANEPIEADAEAGKPAQGGSFMSRLIETFMGPSEANEEDDEDFSEENETAAVAVGELLKNKAEEKSELETSPKQTTTVEKSKILDGQLDASKDSQHKSAIEEFYGTEEKEGNAVSKDGKAAPSEIKSELSANEKSKELTENKSQDDKGTEFIATGEAPKEKADKKDSTLATGAAVTSLDEISEASPDLTIAFLILLGLGISVFYNQSQQDQGAAQFNYKETNTLASTKGDEASLFSSWHADPNIGNRQRSHNLLQVQDEEINF